MPWIESHSVLGRHRKIKGFARQLNISIPQAVGHLHLLWHSVIEQAEDGDLSKWSDDSICECASFEGTPKEFLGALRGNFLLDGSIIHDWLDYAGRFLITRYKTHNPKRLSEIWAKFGKIYGKEVPSTALVQHQGTTTLPNLTLPNQPNHINNGASAPDRNPGKPKKEFEQDSTPLRLAKEFFEIFVSEWGPGSKPPNYQTWARDFDLMLRVDSRTEDEIEELCHWLANQKPNGKSEFTWRSVTLSPKKLREHWNAGKFGGSGFMPKSRLTEGNK